ncbi:MAG: hypothetical protein COS35_04840 [Zetaproteobacteria bacterium CG02_land_8_20_14_3_00_50_9]|nr:MAG: hypothetical protein AUJ57_02380 [Zetaproteobacteria bacterium CG1_02_53_45]PIQ32380.1 MAG: hypothetical protein COW62_07775 [Zetaproteobacteria bacterium CG17_big_fil_post_rev_8_21_14_2_50_50_13]PIV30801.1 MAG: hypothetical protein COS35_04840 [Zetaproteobacteria bacterium CG02_land_8_20_14_3_00_50_9]PIY54691.1 MAG: hypothetical protein COZ00_13445 [Zetaproteobacteria bacterium CG_4_10_14_0_8_um_filter_49_80]
MVHYELAPWGMFFAGLMYVVGNGVWMNHLVRQRRWLGWLFWLLAAAVLLVLAAMFETRLDADSELGVWERLSTVDLENHWIAVTLFALISVPGAASVLLKQTQQWTRYAVLLPVLMVFIPLGSQIQNPDQSYWAVSLGVTVAVFALMLLWQSLLDCEPEEASV